ncbi:virion structural protein [Betalipothrixvirus uzonense]|uniref:Viral structural protein n=1 Tax=Betalipothrixvirus uzonense TaxID=512792 RepID=B2CRL4_9VIRU|nr:virion structural protein [Acidianus filamentous virus 9]ACB37271.1 viral structural protein [Acidianus filamentous virus 9]
MVQWTPAIFPKLLDYAKKNGVERRFNTYYIKGVALVQCNEVSINVTVTNDHLHMFYDPVLNRYSAFSMPFYASYPNALQLFMEARALCSELEKMVSAPVVSPASTPPKQGDFDLDRLIVKLSLKSGKSIARGSEWYRAKDYVHSRYPECWDVAKYFGLKGDVVKFVEAIFAHDFDRAGSILTLLAMDCSSPECVERIGHDIDECRKVISAKEVR